MFKRWLIENKAEKFDFSDPLFAKGSDRAFWDEKREEGCIEEAYKFLDYDWPAIKATDYIELHKSGSRVAQEKPHFARRHALVSLVLGEVCEYKGRFIPDIVNGLFAICEESFWGVSAHLKYSDDRICVPFAEDNFIDLFAAETGAVLATACYLLEDEINQYCPEMLKRVDIELEKRIKKMYLTHIDWSWMGYSRPVNNWNPWILSNILTVFLLSEKNGAVLANAVNKMIHEINAIYTVFPADGGCDEGASYWMVSGASLFEFMEQLYLSTNGKINFYNDEKIKNIAAYARRAYIGNGYFVNYSDGAAKASASSGYIFYMFGKRVGDPRLSSLAKELYCVRDNASPEVVRDCKLRRQVFELMYKKEIERFDVPYATEDCLLPDLQNAYVRAGDWFMSAKGGHNKENHNHNDVGSFIAYCQNRPVLVDPGIGTYTKQTFSPKRYEIPAMQSAYHNLPLINGVMQKDGMEFAADGFSLDGKTVSISFAGAYPKEAGVKGLKRAVTVSEKGVDVTDSFEFTGKSLVCEHFMTPLCVRVEGDSAVLGERFILTVKGAKVTTDILDFEGDMKYIRVWDCEYLTRIKFEIEADKTEITLRRI